MRNILELKIRELLALESAADVADIFLSPYVDPKLLNAATLDEGPPMWIVNRSDVYSETLDALKSHPQEGIALRAREKLMQRSSGARSFDAPDPFQAQETFEDFEVEEILGHPLVPLEAIEYFIQASKAEHRASAALSLARRFFEYPPTWALEKVSEQRLRDLFSRCLLEDSSDYVKSYVARLPLLDSEALRISLSHEKNTYILSKLLQNKLCSPRNLQDFVSSRQVLQKEPMIGIVSALDSRLARDLRKVLLETQEDDSLASLIHRWHLTES